MLISDGYAHPLGATGLAQCFELKQQLRGSAGARQVDGARVALQHNLAAAGGKDRGRSVRRCRFGRSIEYHQGVSDEIERPLCQSASKIDPLSASKIDPPLGRARTAALALAERVGVAQPGLARFGEALALVRRGS